MNDHRAILVEKLMALTVAGYPQAPGDRNMQRAWVDLFARMLQVVPEDEVAAAFDAYMCSTDPADRYMPTPGRILALTAGRRIAQAAKGAANARWETALRLIGSIGVDTLQKAGEDVLWGRWPATDPLTAPERQAVILGVREAGGWAAIGRHTQVGMLRPSFARGYEAALDRAERISPAEIEAAHAPQLVSR